MAVEPVPVGALHHHIICLGNVLRIADQRLVHISDVAGKYNLFGASVFRQPHLNKCRAQQVACIRKPDLHPLRKSYNLIVLAGHKVLQNSLCIIHRVERRLLRTAGPLCLPVLPLCL